MKRILALLVFSGCGGGGGGTSDAPPPEADKMVSIDELEPTLDWDSFKFVLPAGEKLDLRKDLLNYFESQVKAWNSTLSHGYIPHIHLANPKVTYVDATEGRLKGMEKLRPVWDVLYERCPSLDHGKFKAPLNIFWKDRHVVGGELGYGNDSGGSYFHPTVKVRHLENGKPYYMATFFSPNQMDIWGEKKGRWNYPKQTHKEIYGFDAKDTPSGVKSGYSLDTIFAHEIGHHVFNAWSMNNGRSQLASYHFSEGMAEIVKETCYGGVKESPYWLNQFPTKEKLISLSSDPFPLGEIYFPNEVRHLISYEKKWGNLEPDRLFKAMVDTWGAMEGRRIKCIPKRFDMPSRCMWETSFPKWVIPDPEKYSPLAFTRGEFAQLFCDHYDCPDEFKPIFKSVSDKLRDSEY